LIYVWKSSPLNKTNHATEPARDRILGVALRLFAENGFKKTSVREIAKQSSANIASISYYFGDKEGLYKAAFSEPLGDAGCSAVSQSAVAMLSEHEGMRTAKDFAFGDALKYFYAYFLAPLARGEEVRLVMKLHFREMLEPTGLWKDVIENEIEPDHQVMVKMLLKELNLKRPDIDVQRLALSLVGMAVHFFVGQDVIEKLAPKVIATPKSIEVLAQRLAMYGSAMVAAEKQRRLAIAEPHQTNVGDLRFKEIE
jgi:TetR/AcrR family transcriptional regulator, regulator of cefoperazone and chloramphenicol sensitivity